MTTDRVTQVAAEAVVATPSRLAARVSQVALEGVVSTPSSQALRVTQVALEVIVRTRPLAGWTVGSIRVG